jgi:hypothetical protein
VGSTVVDTSRSPTTTGVGLAQSDSNMSAFAIAGAPVVPALAYDEGRSSICGTVLNEVGEGDRRREDGSSTMPMVHCSIHPATPSGLPA